MNKNRLEAFSDGVLAIIITIMVLEMKVPHGVTWHVLLPLLPVFLSYVLSFAYIGIYWNNHHRMLHATRMVTGGMMLANLHLLFWLSLVPFVTGWMGENNFAALPTALYGLVLLMSGFAYRLLQNAILCTEGKTSLLAQAVGEDRKGKASLILYLVAVIAAFYVTWLSQIIYVLVALMWIIPDRRIERVTRNQRAT